MLDQIFINLGWQHLGVAVLSVLAERFGHPLQISFVFCQVESQSFGKMFWLHFLAFDHCILVFRVLNFEHGTVKFGDKAVNFLYLVSCSRVLHRNRVGAH